MHDHFVPLAFLYLPKSPFFIFTSQNISQILIINRHRTEKNNCDIYQNITHMLKKNGQQPVVTTRTLNTTSPTSNIPDKSNENIDVGSK